MIENKKAYHDYFVLDTYECGVILHGHEVKSIRAGKCQLKGSWGAIQDHVPVVRGVNIAKWDTVTH